MIDFTALLEQHGYLVLFVAFLLELIALPVPGELLLSYCGLLVFQGRLNWIVSILMAGSGASIGITLSYWIGAKAGWPFFHKYGRRIHLGPERLQKTSQWFERYGNKVLAMGFFIPGVRHITGYFSGITRIPFRSFALYAYAGAFLYTGTFITLGKVLGPKWDQFHQSAKKYLIVAGIIAVVVLLAVYLYRKYKPQIFAFTRHVLERAIQKFHSLGRVRFLVIGASAAFLGMFALMIVMILDLLANEFLEFDAFMSFVVHEIFDDISGPWMTQVPALASYTVLIPLAAVTLFWVAYQGKNRKLEILFLLVLMFGGEYLDETLRRLFHRPGPGQLTATFPSEQTFIVLAVYGFAAFLVIRHTARMWIRWLMSVGVLAVALLVGLSCIELNLQYPSDVVAGYVFGAVWLSLNIIMLESFRQLQRDAASRL